MFILANFVNKHDQFYIFLIAIKSIFNFYLTQTEEEKEEQK